ncbi:hypothetical protein [Serratia sp. Ag2]|nr:hypothetical protein [Serratia sp. Ag2]
MKPSSKYLIAIIAALVLILWFCFTDSENTAAARAFMRELLRALF